MERTRKTDWLMAQGYRPSTLPPHVTWYAIDKHTGMERELKGRTDDYTLNLYRSKGYVLDRKYLDPKLWNELEYRADRPRMTVAPPVPLGATPRLARAIKAAVGKRDLWEVTPAELLVQIGSSKQGIPKTALGLSIEIMKLHMTNALKTYGMTVERKRTESKRFLQLTYMTVS